MSWPFSKSLQPLNPGRTRILIVEDNDLDATLALRAMQKYGVKECRRASSAEEGFQELSKREFDVVLVDYHLPRMNGLDFLREAAEHYPALRVILFTGAKDDKVAAAAIKAGAADYVSKDEFLTSGLINAVQSTLREDEEREEAVISEAIEAGVSALDRVTAEMNWLRSSVNPGYQQIATRMDESNPDVENAVVVCEHYLRRLIEVFPERAFKEEDGVVQMFMELGSSPREALVLLELAFARVCLATERSGKDDLPFSPSLPIARIFIRLVECYQQMLVVDALEVIKGYEAEAS